MYKVSRKGASRSLTLQGAAPPAVAKPDLETAAAAAAAAAPVGKPAASARRLSLARPSAAPKAAAKAARDNAAGPRLKGGRIVYCPAYCHSGECPRRERGCPHRHDPTKRAVCPRWLRGACALGKACPLQHQRRPELMPACRHHLKGMCNSASCPYLHQSAAADAPMCAAFLRGHCAAGAACAHRHFTLRMVKDERAPRAAAPPPPPPQEPPPKAEAGGRQKRRRYFEDPGSEAKWRRSRGEGAVGSPSVCAEAPAASGAPPGHGPDAMPDMIPL